MVYAGYVIDKNGKGIPTDRFDEFLAYMQVAVGLTPPDDVEMQLDETQLKSKINRAYANRSSSAKDPEWPAEIFNRRNRRPR